MSALEMLALERERRHRERVKAEAPVWDWYGPDCGCPVEDRNPDGSCPVHKRARDKQKPPEGDWRIWMLEAGRGFGKTESGAQWIRHQAEKQGKNARLALVAPTAADARDVMVEGPSGVMAVCPPWFEPKFEPSKRRITWPNGAKAITYSADEPERLRGPQHTGGWCDEPGSWRDPTAWDMLMFGMRLGANPQVVMTLTPRPHKWLRAIKARLGTVVVKGSTYENRSHLAGAFFKDIITKYEGTRLGRQELEAEDLTDTPGALWTGEMLDLYRVPAGQAPELIRVVVAIDPSASDPDVNPDEDLAEAGITVGGISDDEHGYLLADRSLKASPRRWAEVAVAAYHEFRADLVVAEVNNGGAMVGEVIRGVDPRVPFKMLHASRGKVTRAEPISSLYEKGRIHHAGSFPQLEEQMCNWIPGMKSPDRMDSVVWLWHELLLEGMPMVLGPHPFEDWR